MCCGEPLLKVTKLLAVSCPFGLELSGQGADDIAGVLRGLVLRLTGGVGASLLASPESFDPLSEVGGGVEEVHADTTRAGDGAEADLLAVLEELAKARLGPCQGTFVPFAGGILQGSDSPLGGPLRR